MILSNERTWWHQAVIYQIYPKSFKDNRGQGTGDLQGIISKLDYLKKLGVDAIWLTPVYQSPQVDNGYDIADYYQIDESYGTMADFDELIAAAHGRDIRIVMDIVVNHTSTQHSWFQQALKYPDSPYRDFYIWKDPVNGGVPNNWQSKFGGSAWEMDDNSGQYYLHLFAREQADLNWENPLVREEVKKVVQFWADKGVDGLRLDVINLISKDQTFPSDDCGDGRRFYTDGPKVHEYLNELNRAVFGPNEVMTVGEMSSTTLAHCQKYSAPERNELSMVFNFHHLKVDYPNGDKWRLADCDLLALKSLFSQWQQGLHNKGWNALFWCNHDQPRIVSRFGHSGEYRESSAKMLATALHMMQGTPYIYQGEEIGMLNPGYESIEDYADVESRNMYDLLLLQGHSETQVMAILAARSRDNSRTPMPWNDSDNAGFSEVTPWLKPGKDYPHINVAQAMSQPDSVFYHYQELIALRKQYPIITEGDYLDLLPESEKLWCYQRSYRGQRLLVVNNFTAEPVSWCMPKELSSDKVAQLISNYPDGTNSDFVQLRPYESAVWLL